MSETADQEKEPAHQTITFSALIIGFSSAALYHIGEAKIDDKKTGHPNLELAQQNIESLEVLRKKTKGNLTNSEEQLLEMVLKDVLEKFQIAQG